MLQIAGVAGVQGGVTLKGGVSGSIDQPLVNLTLQGDHLAYADYRAGTIACEVKLDQDGRLHLSQLDLSHQGANIQGRGSVQVFTADYQVDPFMPMTFDMSVATLKVEDFWTQSPVKATFDGRMHLSGSVKQPQAQLVLQGRGITTLAGPIGDAELKAKFANGFCQVDALDITRGKTTVHLSGRVQVLAPDSFQMLSDPEFQLDLAGKQIEMSDYTDQVSGTIDIRTQLEGTVGDPRGTLAVLVDKIAFQGQPLDSAALDAVVGDRKIRLAPLRIRGLAGDEINARGWIGFDRSFDLSIGSDGWRLTQIGLLKDVGEVAGDLRFDFTGSGTLSAPVIDGNMQVSGLTLNRQPFKDISIDIAFRDQRAQLHATQAFDLEAAYALDSGDFTVAAVFNRTQLKPYFALTGQADFSGMLSGTVKARGNRHRLEQATAQMDVALLELYYGAEELVRTQNLKGELKDRRFVLPESSWSILEQGHLNLQGNGAFDGSIDLSIDGSVPLRAADPFLTVVEDLGGQVIVRATVAGEASNPSIDAQVKLENIAVTLPSVSQRLQGVNGKIQVADSKVTFKDFAGQIGKGRFDLSGTLGLDKWQPENADLVFNAYQLPVEIPDTMSLLLNSSLSFKGDRENAFAEGQITVLDGLYYKDVNLNLLKSFTTVKRSAPPRTARTAIPYFGHTVLDVSVKRRLPIVVENNLAYLEISPDLRMQGTVNNPVLSGRARVDTGDIYYGGKTFVVKRGIVDFLNPYKIEPTLDIHSEVAVRDWLITLLISGTLEDLEVELSSNPPESRADILSLLVAGKTSAEMRGGKGGASMSANQMMAQLVASTFGDDIKAATGIDYLEVATTDDQVDGDVDLIKVTIGKKLTERMTLKYAVSSTQGETIRSTISEYQLMDRVIVSGFQDSQGIYGGEMIFRVEFR
jgi:autotransporter translocation and assembly factor TamB